MKITTGWVYKTNEDYYRERERKGASAVIMEIKTSTSSGP